MLIAVVAASLSTVALELPVATIGSQFGGIPNAIPLPTVPEVNWANIFAVLPNALAFALLGAIESLLSALVADGMTGRRHRSNCELVGQGLANIAAGLFGGFCVTGTIARTATNVRAGARGPIAGMSHAMFLLLFVLVAAPLASFIPLASLAGVLAVVAWNMVEKHAFVTLLRFSRADAAILITTVLLTIFRDLMEAIVVGFALGSVLFIHRLSKTVTVNTQLSFVAEDDSSDERNLDRIHESDPNIAIYRIQGVFFFGAVASIENVLDALSDTQRVMIVDFTSVPFLDSTAANTIENLARKAEKRAVKIILTGTTHEMRSELFTHGIKPPLVGYEPSVLIALAKARRISPGRIPAEG